MRGRLRQWGVRPRRRYAQHFLTSPAILGRIVEAAELRADDTVVEIGAGLGDLTELMASRTRRVIALEVDPMLVAGLRERFARIPRVEVIHADALQWPLPEALDALERPRVIVGNLPYNVATQILLGFIPFPGEVDRMALMFQREVAERLVARVGTPAYGGLTVMTQVDWDVEMGFRLPPGAFHPPPKVESALVLFSPLPAPRVDVGDRGAFHRLVKAAFGQRRKTLKNALAALRPEEPGWAASLLNRAGIQGSRRGETLSLEEFAGLNRMAQGDLEEKSPIP
jgi:16S rRNA (adenine1518-N6/adenine1519-N6)-dimethyltransferase